jgi:hypothetical protein
MAREDIGRALDVLTTFLDALEDPSRVEDL